MSAIVAGVIWILLGMAVVAFGFLFCLEGFLYLTGRALITTYIRNWSYGHWLIAIIVGIGLVAGASAAVTHFIFDGARVS